MSVRPFYLLLGMDHDRREVVVLGFADSLEEGRAKAVARAREEGAFGPRSWAVVAGHVPAEEMGRQVVRWLASHGVGRDEAAKTVRAIADTLTGMLRAAEGGNGG